jgi:Pyridoxamine 5'-phosphate oxidase
MGTDFVRMIREYRTCEFATVSRNGAPQTVPVSSLLLSDGRFLVTTSIGLPLKAFNVRRNPKVSLLFSDPTGSGITEPAALLIQGDAVSADQIVADVSSDPDLAMLTKTVSSRQPASSFMRSRLGRQLFPYYWIRILIHVTPRRVFLWPTRDFTAAPQPVDVKELQGVG